MKKIFLKFSLLSLLLSGAWLTSCESLNLTPQDYFGSSNYWKNEAQVNGYMINIHRKLRDKAIDLYWLGEGRSQLQVSGKAGGMGVVLNKGEFISSQLSQTSPGYKDWAGLYPIVFDCNLLISEVTAMKADAITDVARAKYLAQAYSVRAYIYFALLKTYGGVPIITEPKVISETDINKLYCARSTAEQTMDQITEDLKKSEANYANDNFSTVPGRCFWSKAATKALTGEVYLWKAKVLKSSTSDADLQTALTALQAIPNGSYDLQDKYLPVFTYANKGNNEIILAMNYDVNNYYSSGDDNGNYVNVMLYGSSDLLSWFGHKGEPLPADSLGLGKYSIQRLEYKFDVFKLYDNKDIRARNNFFDFYKYTQAMEADPTDPTKQVPAVKRDANGKPILDGASKREIPIWVLGDDGMPKVTSSTTAQRKYLGTKDAGGNRRYCDDIIIYRYADVLLLIAEAKNSLGQDPSPEINRVRERAYRDKDGKAQPYPVYAMSDFTTNELAIYFERVKELVMEGKAFNDLCRMQSTKGGDPLAFDGRAGVGLNGSPLFEKSEAYKLILPIDNNVMTNDESIKPNPGWNQF